MVKYSPRLLDLTFAALADPTRRRILQHLAEGDPSHLLVMFLKKEPDRDSVTALQKSIKGREIVKAKGRHAYIVYPDGVGRSRLTNTVIEKALGTSSTGRNWNTVLKLADLAK